MEKRKLTIVINEQVDNSKYLQFLQESFDLNVVNFNYIKNNNNEIKIDLVLFIGGEDVEPFYYNQNKGKYTKTNSERDKVEKHMFNLLKNIPKLGICRGAQFLTVMNKGLLIQHTTGHTNGNHIIEFNTFNKDLKIEMTSTHHQMMYPFNLEDSKYELIAHSDYNLSNIYLNDKNTNIKLPKNFVEPEIIYYHDTNSLCIQGHPELNECPKESKKIIIQLIKNYLLCL